MFLSSRSQIDTIELAVLLVGFLGEDLNRGDDDNTEVSSTWPDPKIGPFFLGPGWKQKKFNIFDNFK